MRLKFSISASNWVLDETCVLWCLWHWVSWRRCEHGLVADCSCWCTTSALYKIIVVHLWHWIWWLLRVAVICDFAYVFKGSDKRNMAMKLHDAYHFKTTSNIYETYVWTWTCTLPPIIMVSWKMGPSNSSFLSFRVIFHFHDHGRKDSWTLNKYKKINEGTAKTHLPSFPAIFMELELVTWPIKMWRSHITLFGLQKAMIWATK